MYSFEKKSHASEYIVIVLGTDLLHEKLQSEGPHVEFMSGLN
jgi:hypothetical protein